MCRGDQRIFFAWAKNAQPKAMPDKVSFQLDPKQIKYLVLQVRGGGRHMASPPLIHMY